VFNLGAGEITVILVLALIFIGPKQLPELASKLGKVIRDIRKAAADVKNEIALDESFRKPFEELHDAVTLHPDELRRREEIKRAVAEAKRRAEAEAARMEAEAAAAAPAPVLERPNAATAPEASHERPNATPASHDALPAAPIEVPGVPPPPVARPIAAPAGTVAATARTVQGVPPAPEPDESAPSPVAPGEEPAPLPAPVAAPRSTPGAGIISPGSALGSGPRVTPPISSLDGDRANTTQTLSEADLLSSAPRPPRRPAPPPLPGLDRHPPPANRMGLPRVTPPVSSVSGERANATQTLSETDLLPPGASKPPPLPGPKKA